MCITRRRDKPVPSYSVNNTTHETCDSLRLLGVMISRDLSWNCHVNNITKKCNKLLGFIRVVVGVKYPYVLLKLYQTLILPILDYSSPVWNVYKNCNVEKLEQIQQRATRMILCQHRGEQQYQDRLKTLNLTTLKTRRSYLQSHLLVLVKLMLVSFTFAGGVLTPDRNLSFLSKTLRQKRTHINTAFLFISLCCGHLFHLLPGMHYSS